MTKPDVIILGGGAAGLAMAHYSNLAGKQVLLLEREESPGGNARTFRCGDFLYDAGAHRWHNVSPEITRDVSELLEGALKLVNIPSGIAYEDRLLRFPFELRDLFRKLSLPELTVFGLSFLTRNFSASPEGTFAEYVQRKYGRAVSEAFLRGYSEKLWGLSPEKLLPEIAGSRLRGLSLSTALSSDEEHLDGKFYYPEQGIGQIFRKIVSNIPDGSLKLGVTISSIKIDGNLVRSIETNEGTIETHDSMVINTLSPQVFSHLSGGSYQIASLRFRKLWLGFIGIKRKSITPFASLYFPDLKIPITRIVEPRNRSLQMAPEGLTSLVAEIPFNEEAVEDRMKIFKDLIAHRFGIRESEILVEETQILPNAYPILSLESSREREAYLAQSLMIKNLRHLGRNARFSYLHLHDLFAEARRLSSGADFET